MSLKGPNSKLMRWRIKLDEYDYEIEYKKGTLNSNADALSRIRPEFQLITTNDDIFLKPNNLLHCVSLDFKFTKGIAEQIDQNFDSKEFLSQQKDKNKYYRTQPIWNNKYMLIHLITKKEHTSRTMLDNVKLALLELKNYLIQNKIFEIHLPEISNELDKVTFQEMEKLIKEIFFDTHIKFVIHIQEKNEIFINDTESLLVNIEDLGNDLDDITVHSTDENEINGVTYTETPINNGENQIIFEHHDRETEIEITKLFKDKQRINVKIKNDTNELTKFLKEYTVPKVKYYCLINKNIDS